MRAAFDVAALIALMLLRRSAPASSLAAAALSIRLGSLVRRIWQTRKASADPIVVRVATTGAVLALGDVAKLVGYSVGLADSAAVEEGLAARGTTQPMTAARSHVAGPTRDRGDV